MPDSYATTPEGILLIANGVNAMQRWDGFQPDIIPAGVIAPTQAVTGTGSGSGAIVGTFYAYLRFLDKDSNPSNFGPVSASFTPTGTTGTITAASNTAPIVITSANHGLATGTTVEITGVGGNTSANNIWIITVTDANNFSLQGSAGTAAYKGSGTWTSGVSTINYSNVQAVTDPRHVRRQILRNTDGQTKTFYVDVDTTDTTSSSLTSTNTDAVLATNTKVPLFNTDGSISANRYGVPPNWKSVIAYHLARMFAAVDINYTEGCVQLVFGSTSVTGIGTEWPATFVGRFLYVIGGDATYQIDAINTTTQTLTLHTPYGGSTDNFAIYAIRPAPGERRLVYYSESGLPEAWPATNAFSIAEDGDDLTGLMPKGSFLYILERRHIYRFTFQANPALDGFVFLSSVRGCVNNRCWVIVEDMAYMLDEAGVHAFSGGQESEPISTSIQELFRPGSTDYRINWQGKDYFHAAHYPGQETIRWFVSLSGTMMPRHAISYNYRTKRWWLEEYRFPVSASTVATLDAPRTLLGSDARRIYGLGYGTLDGADATAGTVRGQVTASSLFSITDTLASFAASGLNGVPVAIVAGTGKGQMRVTTSVSGGVITVTMPWAVLPDSTSTYQLGAVQWTYQTGWFRYADDESTNPRRVEVVFEPVMRPATMDLRIFLDFAVTPIAWQQAYTSNDASGIANVSGSADLVVDLTKATGIVQKRIDGHREMYIDGGRYISIVLTGFSNQDIIGVNQIMVDGVYQG